MGWLLKISWGQPWMSNVGSLTVTDFDVHVFFRKDTLARHHTSAILKKYNTVSQVVIKFQKK